ncbi:MAG: hypothetical protein ILA04_01495 [Prevotella sp.]|nr:hypothetical protein [Prevotella sp.]
MKSLRKKVFILLACSMAAGSLTANAQEQKNKVHLFGMAQSFTDSVVYMTDIHEIDDAKIEKKTKFLHQRSAYTQQLQEHLQNKGEHQLFCLVMYAETAKKAAKKYEKMKKKYSPRKGYTTKSVNKDEFRFKTQQVTPVSK